MNEKVNSVNGVPIRLNSERWMHITMGHPEVADYYYEILQTIQNPEVIYTGSWGELLAVQQLPDNNGKKLIVVYREVNHEDGFVITAYLSNKVHELQKRTVIWQRQN